MINNDNDSPLKRENLIQEHSFLGGGSIQELDGSESSSSYVSSAVHSSAASVSETEKLVKGLSKKNLRVSQFANQGTNSGMSSFFDEGAERKSSEGDSDLLEIEDKLAQSTVPDLSPSKHTAKQ